MKRGDTGGRASRRWGLVAIVLLIAAAAAAVVMLGDDQSSPESGLAVQPATTDSRGSSGDRNAEDPSRTGCPDGLDPKTCRQSKHSASDARDVPAESAASGEAHQRGAESDSAQRPRCFEGLAARKCERLIEDLRGAPKSFKSARRLLDSVAPGFGEARLEPGEEPGGGDDGF